MSLLNLKRIAPAILAFFGTGLTEAQPLPAFVPNLPAGFVQRVIGQYGEVCPPAPLSGACTPDGDPIFRAMPSIRVDEDGLLYLKYTETSTWIVASAAKELWRVAPDGTKSKILDLPSSNECIQEDAYTLRIRHAQVAEVSAKPSKSKKGESLYLNTVNWTDRFRWQEPVSCDTQPTGPTVFWQSLERSTRAVIAVDSNK